VLADSLASAFSEDPLFGWIVGPKAPLEARMRVFFDTFLKINLAKPDHLVFVSEDGTGAAVWQPVGQWKVPPTELFRGMPAMLRAFRARVPAMVGALNAIEKVHPVEPHYYLEVLGTRKDRQSKGIGSAVINAVLERCDEEGVPAYLESSNPRNVPFYARHGFEVRQEVACGKDAPTCTTMWRDPR
jgi:GNAT superfamily N-acetyltransferase